VRYHQPGRGHRQRLIPHPPALLAILAAAALAVAALVAGPFSPSAHAVTNTSGFKGVNWADPRDNFVNGPVVPSGLSTSDSYATTYAKATAIVSGFKTNLGANTVRFGMNDKTTSSAWWNSYIGALDATLAQGMNVMIAPWAYPGACACVKDTTAFYKMWDTVINRYLGNPNMYFEIYNEPGGYSSSAWVNFAASFVAHYPNVPRGRIVVAGTGTDTNLGPVGSDSRLSGTLLSLHLYSVFGISHDTEAAWVTELNNHLRGYGSRTIITEFGVPMSTGVNYDGARDGDNNRSYYWAMTDTMRSEGVGSIYWPGLRNGDSWSMEQLHGTGTDLSLTTVNASGRDRLEYAWGGTGGGTPTPSASASSSPSASPSGGGGSSGELHAVSAGKCLDVPNATQTNSTQLDIYTCSGASNQIFAYNASHELTVYGGAKCVDAYAKGTTAGTKVDLYDCNGGSNQQWNINSNGTITGVQSGLCLDVTNASTANGALVELWTCNGGSNQQWSLG